MTEFNTKNIEKTLNKLGRDLQTFLEGLAPEKDLDTLNPDTDFVQTTDGYEVYMELPGLTKADIKVELVDNVLTIKGERTISESEDHVKWMRRERKYGRFSRSFPLGHGVDKSGIKATFKDGVLRVQVDVNHTETAETTIEID
jgi:HSP20 family protein